MSSFMRSYRQMKDVGKAHYYEAKAEACERRSAEHAVPVRPAGIGAILWLLPVLSHSAGLSGLSPRRAAERHGVGQMQQERCNRDPPQRPRPPGLLHL